METCSVYLYKRSYYVIAEELTVDGLTLGCEPMVSIPEDSSPQLIGEAVWHALNSYKSGVPSPADLREVPKRFLKFVNVKNWSTFALKATSIGIKREARRIEVLPYELGEKNAFFPKPEKAIACNPTPTEVGKCIKSILTAAT